MVGLPWNTTLPQPVAQAWRHAPSRNLHAKVLNINRFRNIACAEGLSQTAQSQPHRQCVARAEFAQTWQPTANLPAHLQYEVLQWLLEMHWSMEPGALMGCLDNPSAMDQSLGTLSPVILGAIEVCTAMHPMLRI